MQLELTSTTAALFASIISILSAFYFVGLKLGKLETKVETLWSFMMRRAQAETVFKGYADKMSPLTVKPEALKLMEPLAPKLRAFYNKLKAAKTIPTDRELFLMIEERFGEEILDQVCIPNGLMFGACMPIAIAVAKGNNIVCLT